MTHTFDGALNRSLTFMAWSYLPCDLLRHILTFIPTPNTIWNTSHTCKYEDTQETETQGNGKMIPLVKCNESDRVYETVAGNSD